MKTNYHTHTYRCKHAMGNDERIVLNAIKADFDILGFSDHTPWPHFPADYDSHVRMEPQYLPEYCGSVNRLREKYKDQIEIHLGLEAEYFPHHMQELLDMKSEYGIEYLIYGAHYDELDAPVPERFYFGRDILAPHDLERYEQNIIPGIESKFYTYVAHPDLSSAVTLILMNTVLHSVIVFCETAARCNAILEYNISGFLFAREHNRLDCFPHPDFWRIAKDHGITAIIGFDAHDSAVDFKNSDIYDYAVHFLDHIGIHRIDKLDL